MHPILLQAGPLALSSHATFILLGVLAAGLLFRSELHRRGLASDPRLGWIVAAALFGGAIGAKLSTAWHYVAVTGDTQLASIVLRGGRSILGGLTGAYLAAVLARRLVGYPQPTGDLFAPGVALGMAIGRVGCLLTEAPGRPTSLPWGIALTPAQAAATPGCPTWCADGIPMHPSFVYESIFHLAAFGALLRLRHRPGQPGDLFKLYLLGYGVFRFMVEFVRTNQVVWHGLTRPQLFLIPAVAVLVSYFVRQRMRKTILAVRTQS